MIGPITSVGTTATMGAGSVLDDGNHEGASLSLERYSSVDEYSRSVDEYSSLELSLVGNGSRTRMVPDEWPSDTSGHGTSTPG